LQRSSGGYAWTRASGRSVMEAHLGIANQRRLIGNASQSVIATVPL
jgi:hypothetical protein